MTSASDLKLQPISHSFRYVLSVAFYVRDHKKVLKDSFNLFSEEFGLPFAFEIGVPFISHMLPYRWKRPRMNTTLTVRSGIVLAPIINMIKDRL